MSERWKDSLYDLWLLKEPLKNPEVVVLDFLLEALRLEGEDRQYALSIAGAHIRKWRDSINRGSVRVSDDEVWEETERDIILQTLIIIALAAKSDTNLSMQAQHLRGAEAQLRVLWKRRNECN